MKHNGLPELLSPAGSPEAFEAAIDGGADAIYVGGASFNARINAKNFGEADLAAAIGLAHTYGVKVYQTVNIMVHGRELSELLQAAERSADAGIDAFIVSDLGAASLLHKYLPSVPLHGSTQMSVHNADGAKLLASRGFTRVVPARELSCGDIRTLVEENPLEVEIFIHGAMCVSHSGQCLFSSLVGGRSGNRGLCAQPCRLPYAAEGKACNKYPLSLKDMSLASHVREIIDSGVSSLKIEGRMKSPEYVRGVTRIWRALLDEGRDADRCDMERLSELFSRGGFSDGYYTSHVGRKMLGVRSEEDKQASREVEKFQKIERKIPIRMRVELAENTPSKLTLVCRDKEVAVTGEIPQIAINAPIDEANVRKCMMKLGDSCFSAEDIQVNIAGRLMMPVSQMNALRRAGVEALNEALAGLPNDAAARTEYMPPLVSEPVLKPRSERVGRFLQARQITEKAREFFDVCLLPLEEYVKGGEKADGFVMPAIVFDSEMTDVRGLLESARELGAKYAVVSNIGQIELLKQVVPDALRIADFRFNLANNESMHCLEELGFDSAVVSAELTLPQIRDLKGAKAAIVYGRIPLMTLEKCAIKELYGDKDACRICAHNEAQMTDRRGFTFPIVRERCHRNIVLNSLPTQMSDREQDLKAAGITDRHFLFTVESPAEVDSVIDDYRLGRSPAGKVRRI